MSRGSFTDRMRKDELGRGISEFFEKKKLKSKLKLLESASPKNSSVSLDLLNLFVVNQISSKRETPKKKAVLVDLSKGSTFLAGRNNAELPMSPNSVPSKLCLADNEVNLGTQTLFEDNCTETVDMFCLNRKSKTKCIGPEHFFVKNHCVDAALSFTGKSNSISKHPDDNLLTEDDDSVNLCHINNSFNTSFTVERCLNFFKSPDENKNVKDILQDCNKHCSQEIQQPFVHLHHETYLEKKDAESPISISPSYSPRESDTCIISSSEMQSEDEDIERKSLYDNNCNRSKTGLVKMSALHNNYFGKCASEINLIRLHKDGIANENKIDIKNDVKHGISQENCNENGTKWDIFIKKDAWSQTDNLIPTVENRDASIQCNIVHLCKCTRI